MRDSDSNFLALASKNTLYFDKFLVAYLFSPVTLILARNEITLSIKAESLLSSSLESTVYKGYWINTQKLFQQ